MSLTIGSVPHFVSKFNNLTDGNYKLTLKYCYYDRIEEIELRFTKDTIAPAVNCIEKHLIQVPISAAQNRTGLQVRLCVSDLSPVYAYLGDRLIGYSENGVLVIYIEDYSEAVQIKIMDAAGNIANITIDASELEQLIINIPMTPIAIGIFMIGALMMMSSIINSTKRRRMCLK